MPISAPLPENSVNRPQRFNDSHGGVLRSSVSSRSTSSASNRIDARVVATANITLSGLQTIDGVPLAAGDRVLPVAQTAPIDRVVWVVASGAWAIDDLVSYRAGMSVNIVEGTLKRSTWKLDTTGTIVVGTTGLTWGLDVGTVPDGEITTAKLADNSVTSAKIVNGTIATEDVADDAITFAKTQNIATNKLLGRSTAGTGDIEEIAIGTNLTLSGGTLNATAGSGGDVVVRCVITYDFSGNSEAPNGIPISANADGVTLSGGEKVQVLGETDQTLNGFYVVSAGTWSRSADTIVAGMQIQVMTGGTIYGGAVLYNTNTTTPTVGVSAITFSTAKARPLDGSVGTAALIDGSVTDEKLRDSAALSVVGRSANSTGDPGDIAAATDHHVLRRSGTTLAFGTVATDGITDGAVTTGKIGDGQVTTIKIGDDQVTDAKLSDTGVAAGTYTLATVTVNDQGRVTSAANGSVTGYTNEEAQDAVGTILTDTATVDFTYDDATPQISADVKDNSITDAKLRDSAALSVIGRSANSTGDPADIAASADHLVLRRNGTTIAFGAVATDGIADDAVTDAKLSDTGVAAGTYTLATVTVNDQGRVTSASNGTAYSDEAAQDAVGTILTDSATIDFTYTDATPEITASVKNASIATAHLADGSVTDAKLRDSAGLSVIGRSADTTGDPADITAATDHHVLRRSGTTLGFGTVATDGISDSAVTTGKINDAAVTTGKLNDAAVTTGKIGDAQVAYAKIQNVTSGKLLGRSTAGAGVAEELSVGTGLSLSGGTLSATGSAYTDEQAQDAVGAILTDTATIDFTYDDATPQITADVKDNSITDAKLRDSAALSVIGRASNSSGDPADITAGSDGYVLRRSGTSLGFGTVTTTGIADAAVTLAKLSATGAASGQVITYNGSTIVWASPAADVSVRCVITYDYSGASEAMSGVPTSGQADGVTLLSGEKVLVISETDQTLNGFWIVAAGAWSRSTDTIRSGMQIQVKSGGALYGGAVFYSTNTADPSVGSDNITFQTVKTRPLDSSVASAAIVDNAVTNAKLRDSAALSVIGRSANSTGDPADIAASSDGEVLRRSGTALGFGTVVAAGIASNAVTTVKINDGAVTNAKVADDTLTSVKDARRTVTTSASVTNDDHFIDCNIASPPVGGAIMQLPAASAVVEGTRFWFQDVFGNAGTTAINIKPDTGDTINGGAAGVAKTIADNYGGACVRSDGSSAWAMYKMTGA